MNLDWGALGWGLMILGAFIGWGRLAIRLIEPGGRWPWGLAAAAGIALTVVLGGVANLLHVFSAAALLIYVAVGAVVFAVQTVRDPDELGVAIAHLLRTLRDDRCLAGLMLLLVSVVALRYASAPVRWSFTPDRPFYGVSFNPHDDMHAYLVHPEKLLQTGHLAADPFNDRQMESSLGGSPVLNALARAALPPSRLHLVEDGVCLIAFTGALAALLRALGIGPRWRVGMLLIAQASLEPNLNISSHLSGATLLAACLWTIIAADAQQVFSVRRAIALGLLLAGAVALKSTLIPLAGLLVGSALVGRWLLQRERRMFFAAGTAFVVMLVAVLPWMVAKYQSYGTSLFPVLGRGDHWTATFVPPPDTKHAVWQILWRDNQRELRVQLFAIALASVFAAMPHVRRRLAPLDWAVTTSVLVTWFGGTLALAVAAGGFAVPRYLSPVMVIAVPVLLATGWKMRPGKSDAGGPRLFATTVWCLVTAGWLWTQAPDTIVTLRDTVREDLVAGGLGYPIDAPAMRAQAERLQQVVPPGEKLLVRLTHPFLLDFRRNPVFVADWPGAISPRPGMPSFQGSDALARYLMDQHIRFVAYAYGAEANYAERAYGWMMQPELSIWERHLTRMALDFQHSLTLLGRRRARVYDDGDVFVIDLSRLANP